MSALLPLLLLLSLTHATPLPHLQKRCYYYNTSLLGSLLAFGFLFFSFGVLYWYIRRRRLHGPGPLYPFSFWAQKPEQPIVVVVNHVNGGGFGQGVGMGGYGEGTGQGQQAYHGGQGQGQPQMYGGPMPMPYQGTGPDVRMASPAPAYRGP